MLFIICYLVYVFACFFGYFFRKKPYRVLSLLNRVLSCLAILAIGIIISLGLMSAVLNYARIELLFDLSYCIPSVITAYAICNVIILPFFFSRYGTKNSKGVDFFLMFLFLISVVGVITLFSTVIITGNLARALFL